QTILAGAGEKCGAENMSSPRHFEHLCNASGNLLPKTHSSNQPLKSQKNIFSGFFLLTPGLRTPGQRDRFAFREVQADADIVVVADPLAGREVQRLVDFLQRDRLAGGGGLEDSRVRSGDLEREVGAGERAAQRDCLP